MSSSYTQAAPFWFGAHTTAPTLATSNPARRPVASRPTCGIIVLLPQVSRGLILPYNVAHQVGSQLGMQLGRAALVGARHGRVVAQRLQGGSGEGAAAAVGAGVLATGHVGR